MSSEQLERSAPVPSARPSDQVSDQDSEQVSGQVSPQVESQEGPFIQVDGLTKVFTPATGRRWWRRRAQASGFRAVDDVSFEVGRGQTFVIMGLSGSGKSTIIRMLNRLVEPTSGSIRVGESEVESLTADGLRTYRNRTINMVFQHFALFPHKTLVENVSFGLKVRGESAAAREAAAVEALERVGLGERVHALPEQLSGGMRQRVGLARALATDAEILLMDEPFSALDPLIRKDMQELLLALQQELRKTIIFVTHDLNEAMHLGDRIMVMKQGRCIQQGTALDLLTDPADPYIEEFVAEVDRGRVMTAGMIAVPGAAEPSGEHQAPEVPAETTVNDLLPHFEAGVDAVRVMRGEQQIGTVSACEVFAALAGGERS